MQYSSSLTLALPKRPPKMPCRHPAILPITWVSPWDVVCTFLSLSGPAVEWGSPGGCRSQRVKAE